ncbi:MAG: DUF2232 domain-containing protein [Cocleimonas sp.]
MAGFIMAGRMQAAIFVVLSTLISLVMPPLIVFSSAAIALITLRQGWQQGILYTVLAIVALILVSTAIHQQPSSALLAGLATWLPMVVTASVLALTKSWSRTLQLVLLLATAGVLLFHFIVSDAIAYWTTVMEQLKPLLKQSYQQTDKQIDDMVNNISSWMTGTFAATFALITIVSLIIARNWQALLYNPGGFGEEFRQITLGKQAALVFLAGTALAVVSNNHLMIELIMVGIVIFMFQGLSLVHALVKQYELNSGWLIGLYILVFILFIQMIVLLATFGVIDNFVNFRRKKIN